MTETLYNLLNSQSFFILLVVWLFICISWVEKSKPVFDRLQKLALKPIIFKTDPEPANLPLYPRSFLEDSALAFRDSLRRPFAEIISVILGWISNLSKIIYDKYYPFRTVGYFLFFVFFLVFVLGDAIAIANALVALQLLPSVLPNILSRFEVAVFSGSLLSLVVGMTLVFEIQASKSELSEWSDKNDVTRRMGSALALLVTLFSFTSLIAWALFRLISLGKLESNTTLELILNWVLYGLIPINNALAASLTFTEGIRGLIFVILFIGGLVLIVLYILDFLATLLSTLVPYILDISLRLVYIVVDLLTWFITTPVLAILIPFRLITRMFAPEEDLGTKNQKNK
jgi:hypothetical protein